ncbi:MAG: D-alanyl-D-alanine carboxypeptidase/D-alanyl-D-alanine-endopeptidase [Rhabdochlamydiaceae bacterium]|nr:D-alanyl-D-alanine carboxypeptidase/D-alanyl-D-alanine-endopeptidase [Rhabdochlamydiaceae bacterium]
MIAIKFLLATLFFLNPEDPSLETASVSAYAINTRTGKVIIDHNSRKSLMPGSCMKVVTTAAALQLLGPDFQFQTDLEYDGKIDADGILHGNLYIHGGGDPCLGSERIPPALSWQAQTHAWVLAVEKLGIRKIQGEVIGDAAAWEKALAVPSWNWEDLGNYYGAGACALSFHENAYTLTFVPASTVGAAAHLAGTEPPLWGVTLQTEVTTGPVGSGDQACIYGSEYSPIQAIRGTIPAGVKQFSIRGAIPNPPDFCARALLKALQDKGIAVQAKPLRPSSPRTAFHTTFSPPLKTIVHAVNQVSHNLYAEHLLKKIGEKVELQGSTLAGARAITQFWQQKHIDLKGFNMADGSGLSRKNMITAQQLVAILAEMKTSESFSYFLQSLPKKGTHLFAKSGSMAFVKAYAGYAGDIAFALLVNHSQDPDLVKKIDQFLSVLDQPSADENPAVPSKR